MFRRIGGVALAAATAYACETALSDSLMYLKCSALVRERAAAHDRFLSLVGNNSEDSIRLGPWYDASVKFSHSGRVAQVQLPVQGAARGSDVIVRVIRQGGLRWTLAYNILGGDWDTVLMDALVGMGPGGGLVSLSLLEPTAPEPLPLPPGSSHRSMLARNSQ